MIFEHHIHNAIEAEPNRMRMNYQWNITEKNTSFCL